MEDLREAINTAMNPKNTLIYNGRKLEGYDKSAARVAMLLLDKALGNKTDKDDYEA